MHPYTIREACFCTDKILNDHVSYVLQILGYKRKMTLVVTQSLFLNSKVYFCLVMFVFSWRQQPNRRDSVQLCLLPDTDPTGAAFTVRGSLCKPPPSDPWSLMGNKVLIQPPGWREELERLLQADTGSCSPVLSIREQNFCWGLETTQTNNPSELLLCWN